MTWKLLLMFVLPLCLVLAQDKDPAAAKTELPGSIRGTVTVSGTGKPMPDVEVYANRGTPKGGHAVTDANGRYTLKELPPGNYRVSANAPDSTGTIGFGPSATRQVTLQSGQELEAFDFKMALLAEISGKVVDQNKEPVPDARVFLVVREYVSGNLRAVFAGGATTDDQGEYHLGRVQPGRQYEVLALRWPRTLPAISDAPADPKLRRPAVIPTFYPNSRTLDGAQPLILKAGEQRDGVDIRLTKTPSFCVEGVLEGGSSPADLSFGIAESQPTGGSSGTGGFYTAVPGGTPGPDGKIRVCDLHPGEYEVTLQQRAKETFGSPPFFATTTVTITDRDLENVRVTARPRIPFAGEVVWDGPAPEAAPNTKLNIFLQALSRTERGSVDVTTIPGPFSIEGGLLMDNFAIQVRGVPKGAYLKDITYGGHSIMNDSLRLGTAMGDAGVRIVLARDGGVANTRVTDKDGNPVPDCSVILLPASAGNEATLSAAMVSGKTDLRGTWSSTILAPGKYYVLATMDRFDKSPESIAKLWRSRTGAQEMDISPKGDAALTLTPKSIE